MLRRFLTGSLYPQVIAAIVLGIALGVFAPKTGAAMMPLGEGFINQASTVSRFLRLAPASGNVRSDAPVPLLVTANPAGLAVGPFRGAIRVEAAGQSAVDVTVTVARGVPRSNRPATPPPATVSCRMTGACIAV